MSCVAARACLGCLVLSRVLRSGSRPSVVASGACEAARRLEGRPSEAPHADIGRCWARSIPRSRSPVGRGGHVELLRQRVSRAGVNLCTTAAQASALLDRSRQRRGRPASQGQKKSDGGSHHGPRRRQALEKGFDQSPVVFIPWVSSLDMAWRTQPSIDLGRALPASAGGGSNGGACKRACSTRGISEHSPRNAWRAGAHALVRALVRAREICSRRSEDDARAPHDARKPHRAAGP